MANDLQLRVLLGVIDKALGPLKKITQGSGETAKALKAAREQLKGLNAQQADVSAWRTQRAALEQTKAAMVASQAKVAALAREIAAAGTPTRAMSKDFKSAMREAQRLKDQHSKQSQVLQVLRTRLDGAGISTRNLGEGERNLRQQISDTTRSIEAQKSKLAAMGRARAQFDKSKAFAGKAAMVGAGATAAGVATAAPIVGLVKTYSQFEDAMLGVAKQVDGARDSNGHLTSTYYEMANAIQAMSKRIPMATTDIAALVEGGARMGIQGKENLLAFAETAANAATAFELPADQIGENLARIADLYKLPIKNVSQLGDAINYLDDNAKSKGADIIDVMQRTAGITASVGMSFRDAAALGSTFLTLGSSAEVAGTATNAMIRELAIATQQPKKFQQGLAAVGLEADSIQKGMAKNSTATILKVLDALNKLPKDKQLSVTTQLFGKEYGDDAAKLAANVAEYRRQLELVNTDAGNGSMQREADIRGNTISARWQMLQNRLFNTQANGGAGLRGTVMGLIDTIGTVLDKINGWVQANPALAKGLLIVAAVIGGVLTVFGSLTLAMAAAVGPFAMLRYGMALFGIATNAALWPVLAVIAAVVALAAAAFLLYANWDKVKAYFGSLWEEIKTDFNGGIGGIVRLILDFSPLGLFYRAFAGVMNYFGVDLPARFSDLGGMLLDGLVTGIRNKLGAVKAAITEAGDSTIGWFKEKLDIHSPSRVFAELGGFTMAGLAQGITAGQSGPLAAVGDLGKRLAAAGALVLGTSGPAMAIDHQVTANATPLTIDTRPPLSATASAAAPIVQGDTYNITINTGAGADVAMLRRMVAEELAKHEGRKAARIRSRLGDRE